MRVPLLSRLPTISPAEAAAEVENGSRVLLDVREQREFRPTHAVGAQHVPAGSLEPAALDPDVRYAVVCRSGARSALAVRRLREAGLDAVNVRGGMLAWQRAGLPVITASKDAG